MVEKTQKTVVKRQKKPSLIINAASNWVSLAVNVIVGLFLTPFIISSLGKSGYGIWTLIGSFIGYYGLLNLGVGSAITRYIARYSAQNRQKSLNEVASTALAMFCITGLIAALASFALAGAIADFFNVTPEERNSFVKLVWIIGITTGISFPGSVFGAVITAREHFVANNVITIIRALLRAGLTVVFIKTGWGLVGVGLAPLVATALAVIAGFYLFRVYANDIRLKLSFASRKMLNTLIIYGGFTTVIAVADILRTTIDSFVIGKWVNLEAVGVYGVAALVIRYIARLIIAGMGVLTPRFASLDGSGDHSRLKELFQKSLFASAFLAFGVGALAVLFGKAFIGLWVGDGFDEAAVVLVILVIAWTTDLAQNSGIGLMYALNKHHFYAVATIIEGVANLVLSIILAPRYGIIGVAIGTIVPMAVIRIFIQPFYVSRVIEMKIVDYARPFLLPLIAGAITVLVGFNIEAVRQIASRNYFYLIFSAGCMGICFLAVLRITAFVIKPGVKTTGILRFIAGNSNGS